MTIPSPFPAPEPLPPDPLPPDPREPASPRPGPGQPVAAHRRSIPWPSTRDGALDLVRFKGRQRHPSPVTGQVAQHGTLSRHRFDPPGLAAAAVLDHAARHRQVTLDPGSGHHLQRGTDRGVRDKRRGVLSVSLLRHCEGDQHRHQPGHDPAPDATGAAAGAAGVAVRRRRSPPPPPAAPARSRCKAR